MHSFHYKGNTLYCEEVEVQAIVEEYGTPLYIYSYNAIIDHFLKLKNAFRKVSPLICYSVKANSNLSILKIMVGKGAGLDIVSGGELLRAKLVNCSPEKIVYASVGKTEKEIKEAIKFGIFMFNVESVPELEKINVISQRLKKIACVALRINPQVHPKTHKYITTAKKETKFGMDIKTARKIFLNSSHYKYLRIIGIHIHIGSQITTATPFLKAIKKVIPLIRELRKRRFPINYFNIGGGMGIVYYKENFQSASAFAQKVIPLLKTTGLKVILEPGRFIVGNAGILVTKVLYIKDTVYKRFVVVDSAMNDLIRPALYEAYHEIIPLNRSHKVTKSQSHKLVDVVGPVCESGDFLGKGRKLNVKEGDYLAILGAGAYGFSMSSNYNSRPRAAEVLIKGRKCYLIRKRETYKDLVDKEIIVKI